MKSYVFLCNAFKIQNSILVTLTLYDVSQALGVQQILETSHLLLQLTHQSVVGVLVDHSVAANLFGTISVPGVKEVTERTTQGHCSLDLRNFQCFETPSCTNGL